MRYKVAGRYQLLERVGRGAMGEVYRGRTPADDDDLAVKILSVDLDIDDTVRARFAREARAAAGLRHRNIVRVVDASLDDDPPFIVMEFLRGRSLAARLTERPLPGIALALDIAVQLCEGLHYAHEHGVVHRDVKPANIWLEEDGTLKLLDFGVAHIVDTGLTRHGESVGTLAYTAPEQLTGGLVDRRADVFSVGAVLFELLSGRRPFDGSTPAATLKRVRGDVLLPVGALPPEVPDDVRAAILKATDSQIHCRYDTAADLAVELRMSLLSLPASALGGPLDDPDTPGGLLAPTEMLAPMQTEVVEAPTVLIAPRPAAPAPDPQDWALQTSDAGSSQPSPPMPPPAPQASPWSVRVAAATDSARAAWHLAVSRAGQTAPKVMSTPPVRAALAAAGGLLMLVVVWVWLVDRRPDSGGPKQAAPPMVVGKKPPISSPNPAANGPVEVLIDSRPAGASIWFGNRDSGLRTPARVPSGVAEKSRLTLRLSGYEDASVPVVMGRHATAPRTVTLTAQRQRRSLVLVATGSYPFDVVVGGRVVSARRSEHSVTFTEGQAVRLRAAEHFLDQAVTVSKSPTTEVRAPGLGDLEVRSARETCLVTIDGRKINYPPVKQRVAAGVHIIALADCPGAGVRTRTEVRAGLREAVILR